MANTLTTLAPTLFSAAQTVSAEPFGIIGAINAGFDDKQVAKGDVVKVPVAPTRAASDFTPAATTSTGSDATADDVEVQISKSRKVSWHLTGEQQRSLENGGINQEWVRQLFAQGMRTLRNEAEIDAGSAAYLGASRAYGTAGTTPFASDLTALTNARKILQDNGAPLADLQFVCDTNAGLKLRNLGVLQNAYQAGSEEERRSGRFLPQMGFAIRESAGIALHTAGAGTGYDVNLSAGYAVGDTTLALDGGTVNTTGVKAGDVVTFAGDTNKYVVKTGLTATSGNVELARPGLQATLANAVEMTIGGSYTANLAFERSSIVGIMRPPIMPANPTIQQMLVSDEKGMTYLVLDIAQYGQRTWEVHLAWGFKAVQDEHIMIVLG